MSNLFQRPKPEIATAGDVKKAIDDITARDWQTGYSFAHSVIDDMNLGDGDILYCLRPSWIAEVMNQRLKDEFGFDVEFDKLEKWQWGIYKKQIEHMSELVDLLNWLLDVPEEIRDMV
jgi:hypothetical protein